VNADLDLCDECRRPMGPNDCYAIEYRIWHLQEQKYVRRQYPGAFHSACVSKARRRLDAQRVLETR
jgi:hypothetical protein